MLNIISIIFVKNGSEHEYIIFWWAMQNISNDKKTIKKMNYKYIILFLEYNINTKTHKIIIQIW